MSQWFRKYNLIGWFLCLFCFHNVYAESPFEHANAVNFPKVLSADEAFDLSYTYRGTTLDLSWKIAPQCYLYRESIKVFIHQQNQALLPLLNEASLPSGKTVHDPALGEQVVYTDRLDLSIDLSSVLTDTKQNPLVIEVEYQGCSENGFCYPPMSKTFNITSHSKKIENILPQEESVENKSVENQSKMPTSYLAIIATFYVFGLLLSFTPCVLPMIPILFVVIVGQGHLNTRRAFGVSLCYVLSMAFTYAIAGIIVATFPCQALMQKAHCRLEKYRYFEKYTTRRPSSARSRKEKQ